jgi:hypothetical protein
MAFHQHQLTLTCSKSIHGSVKQVVPQKKQYGLREYGLGANAKEENGKFISMCNQTSQNNGQRIKKPK